MKQESPNPLSKVSGWLKSLAAIPTLLAALVKGQEKQNMDISKLTVAVPAQQAQADALTAKLDSLSDGLESLDAATKPTADTGAAGVAPTGPAPDPSDLQP